LFEAGVSTSPEWEVRMTRICKLITEYQANRKTISAQELGMSPAWILTFGTWIFLGIWLLAFGIYPDSPSLHE